VLVPASTVHLADGPGDWAVVVLAGEVDLGLVPRVREALDLLLAENRRRIVIDLALVSFMDSAGIGVLVYGIRRAEAHPGGALRLAAPSAQVRKLLELTGLADVIPEYADRTAACTVRPL
jgi:anti-sigma B factor antagonist